jgi:membrane protein DedA with SNARE-associated domain
MPWPAFLWWNALGGVAWALTVGLAAYLIGPAAEEIFKYAGLGGVALVLLGVVTWLVWRRRQEPS